MTALYMDGFDQYGDGTNGPAYLNMLDGNWAQVNDIFTTTPPYWGTARTGSGCLNLSNQAGTFIARKVLAASETHLHVSFGFAVDNFSTTGSMNGFIDFRDNSNAVLNSVGFNPSGQIQIYNGQSTLVSTTSGPVLRAQTWHFIELEIDRVAGTFILRVDDITGTGTPALNATIATGSSILNIGFGRQDPYPTAPIGMYWDDVFIRNHSGTINNGWLGDRRIGTQFVNADTAVSAWTPSYYHKFGGGILRLAYLRTNTNAATSQNAYIYASAAAALDIGASAFTMETLVRFDQLPQAAGYAPIFSRWDAAGNQRSYRLILGGTSFNNGCIQFDTSTDGLSGTIASPIIYPWTPNLNQWYAIALVRSAGQLLLFVDGQQLGLPIADARTYFSGGTEQLLIGSDGLNSNGYLTGRLDETRFTIGVGRYTSTYAPATLAFPRGVSDPSWANVVLLAGYDSAIQDESSFARGLGVVNGASQKTPNDGPSVGVYSTVNKANPDDNTFIAASLISATNTLTMTVQPTAGDTVTVGTKNGSTAAVYTFRATVPGAFDVLIDTTAQGTLTNLLNAINAGTGSGTKYGTGTTVNFDVNAVSLPIGQIGVVANTAGTAGNSIASTRTGTAASWATATLTGGQNIPGPSQFLFQRPPSGTTIISALQTTIRAVKTDSGAGTVQTALIGPLGGSATGTPHPLTVSSVNYYNDMIELDPDTAGPLSPTTIINGKFQINRTA